MVDMRFGHGTWAGILAERAKRIQAAKEAEAEVRRQKIKEAKEFEEMMKQILLIGAVILVAFGSFVLLFTVVV